MKSWRPSAATLMGLSFIVVSFLILVFAPPIFKRRNYGIRTISQGTAPSKTFPLDTSLPLVSVANKKAKTDKVTDFKSFAKSSTDLLLVNFWATWCPPCIDELPSLEYLNRTLNTRTGTPAIRVVTVSVDESLPEIANLFGTLDYSPSFPIVFDPGGGFAARMGTAKFPETYLVAPDQKVLYKWVGPQDWLSADVLARLDRVVSQSVSGR